MVGGYAYNIYLYRHICNRCFKPISFRKGVNVQSLIL